MTCRRLAALLAALALLGCQPAPEPVAEAPAAAPAPPPPPPPPTLHFVVYGDTRSRPDKHREVVAQIVKVAPEMVFQTGDMVGGDGSDQALWDEFFGIIAPIQAICPYYPALGNHDRGNPNVAQQFKLPVEEPADMYYTITDDNVKFIVINTNTLRLLGEDQEQEDWLVAQLAAATEPNVFVMMHHPPFSIGGYKPGDPGIRQRLHPIFAQYRPSAVFTAHDHGYYRTERDGVTYVVTAGGGAPLYDQDPSLAQPGDVHQETLNFVELWVDGDTCRAEAKDQTGAIIDTFEPVRNEPPVPAAEPTG